MKSEEFFGMLGDIDDDKIVEADNFRKTPHKRILLKWGALAACFVIIMVLSEQTQKKQNIMGDIVVENSAEEKVSQEANLSKQKTEELQEEAHLQDATTDDYEYGVLTESDTEIRTEIYEDSVNESFREESVSEDTCDSSDDPVSGGGGSSSGMYKEAVESDSLIKTVSDIFGGAYIDESGNYVVVLTEDTIQNREMIASELEININEVVFKKGEYTLAYLTSLQEKISTAMVNGELPFVMKSAVMESSNCIEVGVNTDDETELNKIRQFDTIGGAITFKYTTESFDIKQ